jgi:hypothetical protein
MIIKQPIRPEVSVFPQSQRKWSSEAGIAKFPNATSSSATGDSRFSALNAGYKATMTGGVIADFVAQVLLSQSAGRPAAGRPVTIGRAHEQSSAHPFLISETGFARDHFNRMPTLRDHELRGVESQALDRLGGRRAGCVPKRATELART